MANQQSGVFHVDLHKVKKKKGQRLGGDNPSIGFRRSLRVGNCVYTPGSLAIKRTSQSAIVNLSTNTWRSVVTIGPCRSAGESLLHEDGILWIGRESSEGSIGSELSLSRFDLVTEDWFTCQYTASAPCARVFFTGELVDRLGRFVVFGGKSIAERCLNDVHLLDVATKSWIQPVVKGKPPKERYRHGSCVHYDTVYYYGGYFYNDALNDGIFVLQLSPNNIVTWSKPKLVFDGIGPPPLRSFAMMCFRGAVLLCGGYYPTDFFCYDRKTGKLTAATVATNAGLNGYGFGISAIPLEKDKVLGIFGTNGCCSGYMRVTFEET